MLNVFEIIGAVLVAALAILFLIAATRSGEFRIARTATIQASPKDLYPQVAAAITPGTAAAALAKVEWKSRRSRGR
jgi:integral membrane sensor domain MASE1